METPNKWHIDRGIRLDVVALFVLQLLAGVWYMSSLNTRVTQTETNISKLQDAPARLAVLDSKLDNVSSKVNDIQDKVWYLTKGIK